MVLPEQNKSCAVQAQLQHCVVHYIAVSCSASRQLICPEECLEKAHLLKQAILHRNLQVSMQGRFHDTHCHSYFCTDIDIARIALHLPLVLQ